MQSRQEGCGLLLVLRMQAGRDGHRASGIQAGSDGHRALGMQAGAGSVTAVTVGVCLLPGEELGAETQASAGWSPAACQVGLAPAVWAGVVWAVPGCPSQGSAVDGLGPCSVTAPAHAGRCIGLARPRAAESARAGAAGAADDLQICSGAIPAGFPCVPGAALLPPSQARQPCRLGMAAASASPLPPPPSLPSINRRHTQLKSLSPQAEPQMDFTGQRLLQHVVKHPRGCGRCPTQPWDCCWGLQLCTVVGSCAGHRCSTHVCEWGEAVGVHWAVKMGSWWLGGCADKVQPGSPTLHSQPHTNPSSPWRGCSSPRLTKAAKPAVLEQRA